METAAAPSARSIALLSCAAFASAASLRVCDPLLPRIAETFAATTGDAARVVSVFAVAYGVLQAFYGPLGDHFGKYRLVAVATLACTAVCIAAALAQTLSALVVFRALGGATAAAIIPLSIAWIGDTIPYDKRQATLARFISGQILGVIGGQFIGGLFADTLGWRWSFAALALIFLIVAGLLFAEHARNDAVRAGAGTSGTIVSRAPFLAQALGILRSRWAPVVLLTVFLEGIAVFGALAFIPSFLHLRFGISLTAAGAILAVFGLGGLAYTSFAARLVASIGEQGLALGGGIGLGVGFLALALANSWAWAIPACFAIGLGFYMLHNTLQTNATQMAPSARGTAVSFFASAYYLGQALGVAAASRIVDEHDTRTLFVIATASLPLVGGGFAYALRRVVRDNARSPS